MRCHTFCCSVASRTSARPQGCGVTTKKDFGRTPVVINRLCRRALIGLGLLLASLSTQVHAQSTPKTVTLVVPYAAGGGTDTVARLIGERMSRALGQTVIIENVVGGGSTLANDRVARSAPDGSTVLINHVALLAAPSLSPTLRYETKTAFGPVALLNTRPWAWSGGRWFPGRGPRILWPGSRRRATRRTSRTVVSGRTVTCAP